MSHAHSSLARYLPRSMADPTPATTTSSTSSFDATPTPTTTDSIAPSSTASTAYRNMLDASANDEDIVLTLPLSLSWADSLTHSIE